VTDNNVFRQTYPSPRLLCIRTCEANSPFDIVTVVTLRFLFVTVDALIAGIWWRFRHADLMMVEDHFPHAMQRHGYSFAMLEHVVYLVQPRHRLRGHANPLILVRSLPVIL
jgi:hypothetical protein